MLRVAFKQALVMRRRDPGTYSKCIAYFVLRRGFEAGTSLVTDFIFGSAAFITWSVNCSQR